MLVGGERLRRSRLWTPHLHLGAAHARAERGQAWAGVTRSGRVSTTRPTTRCGGVDVGAVLGVELVPGGRLLLAPLAARLRLRRPGGRTPGCRRALACVDALLKRGCRRRIPGHAGVAGEAAVSRRHACVRAWRLADALLVGKVQGAEQLAG